MGTMQPIPNDALDDRLAIVGTSGSGKTYAAGTAVEALLKQGARVVIIDPLDVWWGLRLSADGKRPGFDLPIFGGAHGDLPLTESSGALVGETIAGARDSCIVSLGGFPSRASERRFMLAFLDALYRKAVGEPVHLIVDEADLFAPQKPQAGDERLLNMMEQIVRRGRIKGFIPWLITQRPAVLNKNVLSQADGLIAMKLTGAHDRDAIGAWIEGQADRQQGKEILGSLAGLQRGNGVVWIPGRAILKTAAFPVKATFDSSRTPKRGEKRQATALKPLDLPSLKERLATVEAEVKSNDPAALKREIAELRKSANRPVPAADPAAIEAARKEAYAIGWREGQRDGIARMAEKIEEARAALLRIPAAVQAEIGGVTAPIPAPARTRSVDPPVLRPARPVVAPVVNGTGDTRLGSPERKILTALAQHGECQKSRLALLTGYSHGGGAFNNPLGRLRSQGMIEKGWPAQITAAGLFALGAFDPLPSGPALVEHWIGQLGSPEQKILRPLVNVYPDGLDKESLAASAGYEPGGGAFNNPLGRLRTLGLVERGWPARASRDLMEG